MEYTIEPNKEGIINKTYCLSDTNYKILNIDKQSTDDSLKYISFNHNRSTN